MTVAINTHPLGTYAADAGGDREFAVRIPSPVGRQGKAFRLWLYLRSRTAGAGTISVVLRHAPDPGLGNYLDYATVIANQSTSATGVFSGFTDEDVGGQDRPLAT